jgi:hypothetical protein
MERFLGVRGHQARGDRPNAPAGTRRQVRLLETESVVSLHSSNLEPLMFALGQKRTSEHVQVMSALPPKADIAESDWHVRHVPKADISQVRVGPAYRRGPDCLDWSPAHWRRESAMSDIAHGKSETQSPQAHLIQMATAHWVSRFLYVAAQMNLADQLADRPKTAKELAQATGADSVSLYRMMRTMASLGLFTEDAEHRFSLTRLGEPLRTGVSGSVRGSVLTLAGGIFTKALDHLLYSVQTGKTGFEKAFEVPLFNWLAGHPTRRRCSAKLWSRSMERNLPLSLQLTTFRKLV